MSVWLGGLVGILIGVAILVPVLYFINRKMYGHRRKWCDECNDWGHRKWLFLGTHRTHRLYLRWKLRRVIRRVM